MIDDVMKSLESGLFQSPGQVVVDSGQPLERGVQMNVGGMNKSDLWHRNRNLCAMIIRFEPTGYGSP